MDPRASTGPAIARATTVSVLFLAGLALAACYPTPFSYVLNPIGTALAPARTNVITQLVMPTPVVVVITPKTPTVDARLLTPSPSPEVEIIVDLANVRSGPGTNYSVLVGLQKGARVRVQGTSPDRTWLSVVVPATGVGGWITKGAVDAGSLPIVMPTVPFHTPAPTSPARAQGQTALPTAIPLQARSTLLLTGLQLLVKDPRYDPLNDVLHKYVDSMDVEVGATSITITVSKDIETAEHFVQLGVEVLQFAAIVSHAGEAGDWGVSTISFVSPGPEGSSARLFLEGRSTINQVANGSIGVYEVMESEINWGGLTPN